MEGTSKIGGKPIRERIPMKFNRLLFALIFFFFAIPVTAKAQVAPAAYGGGRPIGVGFGMSDYSLDYGSGRRMAGPVVRLGIGLFHGLGVDGSARSLFMFTPTDLTRMQQSTFTGGVFYDAPAIFGFRPFLRGSGGLGLIEFPSPNPKYTRDSYSLYAESGGFEFHIVDRAYLRAEYEYQNWLDFRKGKELNPQGATLGVTYYLNGKRGRSH